MMKELSMGIKEMIKELTKEMIKELSMGIKEMIKEFIMRSLANYGH